mmetsp:Transcript_57382/g.136390  ORF Transcript_57382/g.136390 Transcript_57382/m.136390 type:complete len:514 (+) Transcript_57382:85-1626(+)
MAVRASQVALYHPHSQPSALHLQQSAYHSRRLAQAWDRDQRALGSVADAQGHPHRVTAQRQVTSSYAASRTIALGAAIGFGMGMLQQHQPCRFGQCRSSLASASSVAGTRWWALRRHLRHLAARRSGSGEERSQGLLNAQTGAVLLFVLAVLYGANVPLLKVIETETQRIFGAGVPGPEVLALRFVTTCGVCLPWFIFNFDKAKEALKPGFELALWLWLGYTGQILALGKTTAAITAISTSLVGVTVQGLEVLVEKQPVRPIIAFSSIGVMLGLYLFAGEPAALATGKKEPLFQTFWQWLYAPPEHTHEVFLRGVPGEVMAIMGAIFFGVHVWRCNHVVTKADSKSADGEFEVALAIVQLFATTLLCLMFSWWDSPLSTLEQVNSIEKLGFDHWMRIAACGIVCTGVPSVLELFAFKVVPPAMAALIYCTIPLWGAGLGVVCLHEPFGFQSVVGALLILFCSLAPNVAGLSEQQHQPHEEQEQEDSSAEVVNQLPCDRVCESSPETVLQGTGR